MKKFLQAALLLIGFISPLTFALSSDKQQNAYLQADSATLNYKTGVSTYRGHVKLTQGSTVITADTVVAYANARHQLEKAIATGQFASYSILPDNSKLRFTATAQTINYYVIQGQVAFMGAAKATQGHDSFAGPRIDYDMKQQIVTSPASPRGRTTIIIQPDQK